MKVGKMKDGNFQVYWRIKESTWENIVRASMERHLTPEQLLNKAIEAYI